MIGTTMQFPRNGRCDSFGSLVQGRVVEVNVVIGCTGAPMPKQASRHMQALAVHDCVRGVRITQVMQPSIHDDPRRVACSDPEPVKHVLAQRICDAGSLQSRRHKRSCCFNALFGNC